MATTLHCSSPASALLRERSFKAIGTRKLPGVYLWHTAHPPLSKMTWQVSSGLRRRPFSANPSSFAFYPRYTEEELDIVRQAHREGKSRSEVFDIISGANTSRPLDTKSLYQRALGKNSDVREYVPLSEMPMMPARRAWTPAEIDTLVRAHTSGRASRSIAKELGRSLSSVMRKIYRIKRSEKDGESTTAVVGERPVRRKPRPYTEADDCRLEELWRQGLSDRSIAQEFSFKPHPNSVAQRRMFLGLITKKRTRVLSPWTTANDDDLRQLCADPTLGDREIGMKLSPPRSKRAVAARKKLLGLTGERAKIWSAAEDERLRQLVEQGLPNPEIVKMLPITRSHGAVLNRLRQLNLRQRASPEFKFAPRAWTEEDIQNLIGLRDAGMKITDIAKNMGRSHRAIERKLLRLKHAARTEDQA